MAKELWDQALKRAGFRYVAYEGGRFFGGLYQKGVRDDDGTLLFHLAIKLWDCDGRMHPETTVQLDFDGAGHQAVLDFSVLEVTHAGGQDHYVAAAESLFREIFKRLGCNPYGL